MVFSSLLFLFRFLPGMLFAYYVSPRRYRNGVLFMGSLIFYGWGEPRYIGLLLFSTVVDFWHGRTVGKLISERRKREAGWVVLSSVAVNLGLLGFFKYAGFLTDSWNLIFGVELPAVRLALPIGISFYTFQTMSYTVDIYRGKAPVQTDILAFGAYVSMFPQLIAGPIVRYHTIADELKGRRECYAQFAQGVRRFTAGLGKKVLIANPMGELWSEVMGIPDSSRTVAMAWLALLAFGMQIYFDFSGYSDMAIGLGHMLGFHFPENFRYPYTATSITDFWRRWHMTLGEWFREYVYLPLGGNRKGDVRRMANILLVWGLTGIWHGAGWNFLLWGLYFGVLLILEKQLWMPALIRMEGSRWGRAMAHAYAMALVFLGWALFSHDDIGEGWRFLRQLFGGGGVSWQVSPRTMYLVWTNLPLIAISLLGSTRLPRMAGARLLMRPLWLFASLASVWALSIAYLVNAGYNPFLYFRF